MRKLLLLLAVWAVILPFIAKAEVSYTGSSTIGEEIIPEAAKAFTRKTGIKFGSIENPGSGKGIQALLEGKTQLAGVSRSLTASEKAEKLNYQIIGYDAIAVFVHKNNPVKNVSKEQIKDIFTGKIKNWKQVGGKDAPIVCITEIWGQNRATMIEFQRLAMDGAEYTRDRKEVDKPIEQVAALIEEENGICNVTLAFKRPEVKALSVENVEPGINNVRSGSYLFSRPLILLTKGLPKGDVKKFIDFILSSEGQKIVEKHFVTVK